jgi:hypothetical protein
VTNPSRSPVCTATRPLSEQDIAFALAWEVHAPGLGGWTVQIDTDEDGTDMLFIDPPLVYGDGFVVRSDAGGVMVTSPLGIHRAATVRDALLLICPLGHEALDAAERLAAIPEPVLPT